MEHFADSQVGNVNGQLVRNAARQSLNLDLMQELIDHAADIAHLA